MDRSRGCSTAALRGAIQAANIGAMSSSAFAAEGEPVHQDGRRGLPDDGVVSGRFTPLQMSSPRSQACGCVLVVRQQLLLSRGRIDAERGHGQHAVGKLLRHSQKPALQIRIEISAKEPNDGSKTSQR